MTAFAAPFAYDFGLDRKSIEVADDGSVWIEGYASDWGLDRQDEYMAPGAFQKGLRSFMETNPVMLYHHSYDRALGQFTEAYVDQKGLFVKGRIDKPAKGSWAEDVVAKIVSGTIRGFSVAGIFRRVGNKIVSCDLGEISVTPFPVNPRTTFAVVSQKAFAGEFGPVGDAETVALNARIDRLAGEALAMHSARLANQLRSAL